MDENTREHKVTIENRERLTVGAVESFDEEKVVILTDMGTMTVSGSDFRINRLNIDDGQLVLEGSIDDIQYSDTAPQESGGFFSRLFK